MTGTKLHFSEPAVFSALLCNVPTLPHMNNVKYLMHEIVLAWMNIEKRVSYFFHLFQSYVFIAANYGIEGEFYKTMVWCLFFSTFKSFSTTETSHHLVTINASMQV